MQIHANPAHSRKRQFSPLTWRRLAKIFRFWWAVGSRLSEPSPCQQKQLVEYEPLSGPWNHGLVQVPMLLPRLIPPVEKTERAVGIHVRPLRKFNSRINDADFRRIPRGVMDLNAIALTVLRRLDAAATGQFKPLDSRVQKRESLSEESLFANDLAILVSLVRRNHHHRTCGPDSELPRQLLRG